MAVVFPQLQFFYYAMHALNTWKILLGLQTIILSTSLLMGCQELPPPDARIPSHAFGHDEASNTALSREIARDTAAHPDESGVFALTEPRGAFAARAMLAATAEHTLDVSITSGATTSLVRSCSKHCSKRRVVACACGCCSMI
ncbi:hypothetical protein [Nitrosococcus oceani]|uniref:hypothetical protein n=1 Tax=Nitrosococcus oceani TaxID=1229 RepID=UPI001E4A6D88|nr:hypothetical protein [Nitrosococcus oceani]